jgi:phosphohistidine swiveling domain-containing protein
MSKYERHLREYTVVGATAVFGAFVEKEFINFYGGSLELIVVVKNGLLYHYQIPSERSEIARNFLKKLVNENLDLDVEYEKFSNLVEEYWAFVNNHSFQTNSILQLFDYYKKLLNLAVVAIDCVDVIDELSVERQSDFIKWAENVRKKEESLYKTGEMIYVPKYLEWLSENHLKNYSPDELKYLLSAELTDYIQKNKTLPSPQELRNRKKVFYIRFHPSDNNIFFVGDKAHHEIITKELDEIVNKNIKEFKGVSGYGGYVVGKVRIIRNLSDMSKFQDGEILVASMTEPAYLPIMKKAAAFITDEGGLLCHAAIVSREIKKPCVIGTKIATSILKDGDIVEVDAKNGIIKKI